MGYLVAYSLAYEKVGADSCRETVIMFRVFGGLSFPELFARYGTQKQSARQRFQFEAASQVTVKGHVALFDREDPVAFIAFGLWQVAYHKVGFPLLPFTVVPSGTN